jgi:uncharacterized protein YndB with AHSA1/START domain
MSPTPAKITRRITMERTFDAPAEEVWALWTTKDGIESWWGPEGFRVEVRRLDLRVGGELLYVMIAATPEMVEFMKNAGMPAQTEAKITYTEIEPVRRLRYMNLADFIPGVAPYDVETVVEIEPIPASGPGRGVRMTLTFDAMHDDTWTQRASMGWESELGKLAKVLAK